MAVIPILQDPDPRLRQVSEPVTEFDQSYQSILEDLLDTFASTDGIGLAAPQIGYPLRVLVMDLSADRASPRVLVNPGILASSGFAIVDESCASVPGVTGKVARASRLEVAAQDPDGLEVVTRLEGMEAVCLQHELEHLDGKLFIDRLPLWRHLFRKAG
jgi:peptide deformylase